MKKKKPTKKSGKTKPARPCEHPQSQRIATLGGPGSFDCAACGHSVSTLSKGGTDG